MDMYGIGALSMEMNAAKVQYQASLSVMKASMELPEMAMDMLLPGGESMGSAPGLEAAATGLGQYVDITV